MIEKNQIRSIHQALKEDRFVSEDCDQNLKEGRIRVLRELSIFPEANSEDVEYWARSPLEVPVKTKNDKQEVKATPNQVMTVAKKLGAVSNGTPGPTTNK